MTESEDDEALKTEREEELSVIKAVYPELEIDPSDPFSCSLDLPVQPTTAFRISVPKSTGSATYNDHNSAFPSENTGIDVEEEIHDLSYLPSLQLNINLPDRYPEELPPIIKLDTKPRWIPSEVLPKYETQAAQLWEEYGRVQTLYILIDHLQQAAEDSFGLHRNALDEANEISIDIKLQLLEYDAQQQREVFEKETFSCGVCLEPKKGSVCYRLEHCRHVFCVECLRDFYNNCISEGDVTNVKCLDPECGTASVKTDSEGGSRNANRRKGVQKRMLHPKELLRIPLELEVVRRYVKMRRKKIIESDKDTVFCPRKWCQGPAKSKKYPKLESPEDWPEYLDNKEMKIADSQPVTVESNGNETSKDHKIEKLQHSERLAQCEECSYAFCRVCKQGWHGEYQACWPRSEAEIAEEERETLNYIRRHTTSCPTCATPCQKSKGCNHMQCFQCNTHFCYLCSAWLDPAYPYGHFSNEKLSCFKKLFEGIEGDEPGGNPMANLPDILEDFDEIVPGRF